MPDSIPSGSVSRSLLWIYFLRNEHSQRIKIGISKDVEGRFREHQADTGDELTLLGRMPGSVELEAAIHLAFRHCRVRREWFRPDPDLMVYIKCRTEQQSDHLCREGSDDRYPRRGQPWEEWEDQILLDDHLTARKIASRLGRTPHSCRLGEASHGRGNGLLRAGGSRTAAHRHAWEGRAAALRTPPLLGD